MKPLLHAKISVHKFGGKVEDYIEIHDWFDSTKAHIPNANHRLVLHNSFGIYLAEQMFGEWVEHRGSMKRMPYITISSGKQISIRDIAEQHVIDDMGRIPTLAECFEGVALREEYAGALTKLVGKRSDFKLID